MFDGIRFDVPAAEPRLARGMFDGLQLPSVPASPSAERLADGVVQSVNVVLAAAGCVVLGVLAGTRADPLRLAALIRPGLTVNPARIDGGGPNNVVPDTAVLRVNMRPRTPKDQVRA